MKRFISFYIKKSFVAWSLSYNILNKRSSFTIGPNCKHVKKRNVIKTFLNEMAIVNVFFITLEPPLLTVRK